ncbi:MAG: hypothetical protein FWH35_02275 [Treponema sp.]|nr:hypothetical protein [Treponema sp.]
MNVQENSQKQLYSLIPLDDFKSLMGVDDREDKIVRFCLVTATLSIEQYCKRRLLRKTYFEYIDFYGDLVLPLREFPVSKVSAVYALYPISPSEFIEPDFYTVVPDCGTDVDLPFALSLYPAIKSLRGLQALKVVYVSGYTQGRVPADLASACMELAIWNMNRYRGRRIGMAGNVRGAGKEGEHFEMTMPLQVRELIEPYRRKTI